MDLFDLFARITLDSSGYKQGLEDAEKETQGFGDRIKGGLAAAGKVGAAAIGAVTTASIALTGAVVKGAGELAAYGDNIDKQSQKMGLSAQAYQEWDAILQHSGSSIDAMSRGMITLSKAAEDGDEAFAALGITQEELSSMNQEEIFARTIEGLQGMEEGTERTALASKLLGGAAKELGPLLNTSAEDTEAMRERVHELGGVMSDEAVKAAAAYQDSLQDMTTALSGLKRGIVSDFLPGITWVMDGLTEIFSGGDAEDLIGTGIGEILSVISDGMPKVIETASKIFGAIADQVIIMAPFFFEKGTEILVTIVNGLISGLPKVLEAAGQVIVSVANGIAESLPELIPTVVDVILQIVDTLIDNLDLLIDAAIEIMVALAEGLVKALPRLVEKAPEIIAKLVKAIIRNAPKLFEAAVEIIAKLAEGIVNSFNVLGEKGQEIIGAVYEGIKQKIDDAKNWGKDLIKNFVDGIKNKWQSLKDTITGVADTVSDTIGFSEPKIGPLSDFHTYAPDMMDLFAKGIRDSKNKVLGEIGSFAGDVRNSMLMEPQAVAMAEGGSGAGTALQGEIRGLRDDLARFMQGFSDIRVVLDSGAVVGQLATPMDEALWTNYILNARGA